MEAAQLIAATLASAAAYDPAVRSHRTVLSDVLLGRLREAGFDLLPPNPAVANGEYVAKRAMTGRSAPTGAYLMIYTACDRRGARADGADAIRVAVVSVVGDQTRPLLAKQTRVNRTGTVDGIVERTLERAREAWKLACALPKCPSCGAAMLFSKAGKPYCAAVCWKGGRP